MHLSPEMIPPASCKECVLPMGPEGPGRVGGRGFPGVLHQLWTWWDPACLGPQINLNTCWGRRGAHSLLLLSPCASPGFFHAGLQSASLPGQPLGLAGPRARGHTEPAFHGLKLLLLAHPAVAG